MNFRPEISEITSNETVFSKRITESVQGDVIVPDVKGDIGKILQTDAVAVINSKELSGGRASISGTVYATILYAPQEGGIDSMTTSMDFSHTVKTESDDNMQLSAVCSVRSVEHSMYNTRKMNVKAMLNIKLEGTRETGSAVLSGCECDGVVESCRTVINTVPVHIHANDVIPFRETLDIPAGSPSADSVLKCTAQLTDRDFRLLSNKAVIRGNLVISVLYRGEDGAVVKSEFVQPFTEITDAPGAEEDMKENITASLSPFTASITANGDGNMRAFFVEGKILVDTEAYRYETKEVITDMFCTDFPLELKTRSISSGDRGSAVFVSSVKEIISSGDIHEITDVVVRPVVESCEKSGGTLNISGRAEADLLCRNGNGSFFGVKKSVPFVCSGPFEGEAYTADAEVINPTASASGGDAEIRFTVSAKAETCGGNTVTCVADASPSEEKMVKERPSLVIYYARSGDTLWSIAKNYSVSAANIKAANSLSDTITEGQRIVIPR